MTEINHRRGGSSRWGPVVTAGILVVASVIAIRLGGSSPDRIRAIALAAGVCLTGAVGSWFVGLWAATGPAARVTAALGTVTLRIFPALVALGWLQVAGTELRAAGAGEMLVTFYLASLAADVIRTIMERRQAG